MKKIIKLLLLVLILIMITVILVFNKVNQNNKYLSSITKDIKNNYDLDEEITYSNKYGNYYILTTNTKVIVLNKEFEETLNKDIDILKENKNNYDLIYKNNKLMYEKTILKDNTLTYKYYDATNNKLIKETNMEKK